MTVLITGFGPFDGGSNASEALVRALAKRGLPAVATRVLPVDTERAGCLLAEAVAEVQPSRLLLAGQASGRSRISLERIATNRRDFRVPDIAGCQPGGLCVTEGGPDTRLATWPDLAGAIAALHAAGIPAQISEDCGTHLCNQILYLALEAAERARRPLATTFLHVPLLPEQVIAGEPAALRHAECPFMPLGMTLRATEILIEHAAAMDAAA